MLTNLRHPLLRAAVVGAAAALAACERPVTHGGDVRPDVPEFTLPRATLAVACRATPATRSVQCDEQVPGTAAARNVVVGGQRRYVTLTSSNVVTAPAGDGTVDFSFDVTVQNLIPQPMATQDGVTPHADGVRVFFVRGPTSKGSGTARVKNPTGVAAFTANDQPYFQYSGTDLGADGILVRNETSAPKGWTLNLDAEVAEFDFFLYVSTEVQYPEGYVDITDGAPFQLSGTTQTLRDSVRSMVGVALADQSVTWLSSDTAVARVDAAGVVTAVAPGVTQISATQGPRTGAYTVRVCPNLAVGGSYTFAAGAAAAQCAHGGDLGAEYTLVPGNLSLTASLTLAASATGVTAVVGPPTPLRAPAPAGPALSMAAGAGTGDDWESAFRRRERAEVAPLTSAGLVRRGSSAKGPRFVITTGVPAVGDLMTLNSRSSSACGTPTLKTGVVKVVSNHLIVVADTGNPVVGGFTDADYQSLAAQFDTMIYPTVTGVSGAPADIDGNGRVVAFYTEAVNQLSTPGSGSFIGGFVYARDLFSNASCAGSNQGEMFYMLAADSLGENGNSFRASTLRQQTIGTLAHEFQHLINASRRMYVNTPWNNTFEASWLDEGLAHVMEELLFYRAAGMQPRNNGTLYGAGAGGIAGSTRVTAWNNYSSSNFSRLRSFLARPDTTGPFQADTDLSTRGAIWAFLRYAADRKGGDEQQTWYNLINASSSGLANLQNVLGADPNLWARDWLAAMYADDAVAGIGAQHQNLSWNFRSFYAGSGTLGTVYPLGTRNLGDGAENFTVRSGASTGYLRFGVPAGTFAGLSLTSASATFPLMQTTLVRTK